jgi:hypothetical protein
MSSDEVEFRGLREVRGSSADDTASFVVVCSGWAKKRRNFSLLSHLV